MAQISQMKREIIWWIFYQRHHPHQRPSVVKTVGGEWISQLYPYSNTSVTIQKFCFTVNGVSVD
jgi:hypothetical protein